MKQSEEENRAERRDFAKRLREALKRYETCTSQELSDVEDSDDNNSVDPEMRSRKYVMPHSILL